MKWLVLLLFPASLLQAEDSPRREYALGIMDRLRGKSAEALQRFETARKLDPTAWPLVEIAIQQKMANGDLAGATQLYRDLATARKNDEDIQLGYADFLDQPDPKSQKERRKTLESLLKKWPGDPQIVRRLFSIQMAGGERKQALALIETLSPSDPSSVVLYASLSQSAYPAEDTAADERVSQRYIGAMELHPKSSYLARSASDYFRNKGRSDLAVRMLELHATAMPSSLELRTRLGILYFAAKQNAEGEKELQQVLVIDPHQAMAHQALAKFYRMANQPEKARLHTGELLKIRGGSVGEFLKLSDEFLEAGEARQARILLEKAVFDAPDNVELKAKLAIATRRDPETSDQAARLFREVTLALPKDQKPEPAFLVESAEVFLAEGQTKEAEDRLREAIRTYPPTAKKETAAALRRLAGIWESGHRNEEAARSLRQRADMLDLPQ